MHFIISLLFDLQFKILLAWIRPFCLSPIFIVGIWNEGASRMPLEEFPIIPDEYFSRDKYFFCPRDFT